MDQLIPSLALLIEPFRDCFHPQVFPTFQALLAGWIVCLGPRTISEVWQATGWAARRHHDTAYAVFRSAAWESDDLGLVLATLILGHLIPGGVVWIVVDDTLCHKRGVKVAFGGIFLDAVLSTKRHKTLRFGVNWVVLGVAVPIPMRPDRYFCLPVLWRAYRKKGLARYQSRPHAAAAMARLLAKANPDRTFWLVGDSAYVNAATLRDRPANLQVIGPLHWKAALYRRPEPPPEGRGGRPRKKGDRLPTPKAMIEDEAGYPAETQTVVFPQATRELRLQVVRDVLWYRGCKTDPVAVLLVRDPLGEWRDEALVATDPSVSAEFILQGYCPSEIEGQDVWNHEEAGWLDGDCVFTGVDRLGRSSRLQFRGAAAHPLDARKFDGRSLRPRRRLSRQSTQRRLPLAGGTRRQGDGDRLGQG